MAQNNNKQRIAYAHRITAETHADDVIASYKFDGDKILEEHPYVLDAGTSFTDRRGLVHNDGCSVLAVHAALRLYVELKLITNPGIKRRLLNGDFDPDVLKEQCGMTSLDDRLELQDFNPIGKYIGVQILIHEPGVHGGRKHRFGMKRNCPVIHLYYALSHYTVSLHRIDITKAREFAEKWSSSGYKVLNLADQCTLSAVHNPIINGVEYPGLTDEELARKIQDEENKQLSNYNDSEQIRRDAEIAASLSQMDSGFDIGSNLSL